MILQFIEKMHVNCRYYYYYSLVMVRLRTQDNIDAVFAEMEFKFHQIVICNKWVHKRYEHGLIHA